MALSALRRRFAGPLAQDPGFLRFWTAQTVSLASAEVTLLAVPLTAILAIAIGALIGGALGTAFGPRAVVVLGGSLAMLGSFWLIASPLRTQAASSSPMPMAPRPAGRAP